MKLLPFNTETNVIHVNPLQIQVVFVYKDRVHIQVGNEDYVVGEKLESVLERINTVLNTAKAL